MISSEETKWLHSIIDIPVSTLGTTPHEESTHKTHFRIPDTLLRSISVEDYEKYYVPRVVSIGPFHYGQPHVEPMENFKQKAVRELLIRRTLNYRNCSSDEEPLKKCIKVLNKTCSVLVIFMVGEFQTVSGAR